MVAAFVKKARRSPSRSWRSFAVFVAAIPVLFMIGTGTFVLLDSTRNDDGTEDRHDGRSLTVQRRTTMTIEEHVSTMLTQWNYFNYLNPQLGDLMKQYLPSRVRGVVEVTVDASPNSSSELPNAFVYASWQSLSDTVQTFASKEVGGVPPRGGIAITDLCDSNILLRFAPWCGYDRSLISEWLLDPSEGRRFVESRGALASNAHEILKAASKPHARLSTDDAAMIGDIRWKDWIPVVPPTMLEGVSPGGTVLFKRTGVRYPVLYAARKALPAGTEEHNAVFDGSSKLSGFHACMFGSKRNISSTIERIRTHLLSTTRPQYLHVVTSADGIEDLSNQTDAFSAMSRAQLLNSYLQIVGSDASSFVVMERDLATTRHKCVICRGFFLREVCRATILSEMHRGAQVDLVMIFRPDMYMWNPVHLTPYVGDAEGHPSNAPSGVVHKWRLHTTPLWSLVVDKGFLPTTFGVYNDINITASMVVVHCRVTFPLDMHWIGDPIIVGHWTVMNHWLECFSVVTASNRLEWIDDNAGETHHAAFYRWYMRPLFELGREGGFASDALQIRVFDFQFSLFRSDPIVNAQLLSLGPNYVAYQQQTIFNKFATKWDHGECMRYYFVPKQYNVSSFYANPRLYFFGEIGRVKMIRIPQRYCSEVRTPPGIQTCFAQYQRIIFYKKGKNIHNPCKPYCGVFPLLMREGICAHVGNKGPRQRYISTFSTTPMFRNHSGEVLRFNLVNPQYVVGDTLWFERQRAKEEAKKDRDFREQEKNLLQRVAVSTHIPLPGSVAQHGASLPMNDAQFPLEESFTRPSVGGDGEPHRETKKPRRYHFVRGPKVSGDKRAGNRTRS